ncbi:Dna-directed Rna polymerase II RPB9 [Cardiosporidium cionae]|uniref:Dna-directed Rna polymerase II RPB9 n=1 Tax=Cardiosporidium cionae TaxID=476202 RepID=A0ABQ7JFZ6_9APIC|nr:Dna-directed Rna polymerase II RPB9 [Cardiosporidium cionae]|eukprot:KAF8822888.1 Dna-directed Rna polymerase II RPB9 [Cardiosporidium cionae]
MSSEMIFCTDCNNLMYAQEDSRRKQLKFLCRQCNFVKYADSSSARENCVEHLNYNFIPEEDILVASNLCKDPTLGRTYDWRCDNCDSNQALFFQLPERISDDAMALVFVCCNEACGRWKKQGKEESEEQAKYEETVDLLDQRNLFGEINLENTGKETKQQHSEVQAKAEGIF